MTRRLYILGDFRLLLALLALGTQSSRAGAQDLAFGNEPVTIVLAAEAVVDDSMVTLEQIAKMRGGPDLLHKRLGILDIAEFKFDTSHQAITMEQVRFRLLLAGVEPARFRLEGAKRTFVMERDEAVTRRKILKAADAALRSHLPRNAWNIVPAARQNLEVPVIETRRGEEVRFEGKVKKLFGGGRPEVEVTLSVNGKIRDVVPIAYESADAGRTASPHEKSVVRPAMHVVPVEEKQEIVIRTRDNVKLVAHIGSARVEALGEALQDGHAGQVIRVRNVESNRVVPGRVEASGIVQVEY